MEGSFRFSSAVVRLEAAERGSHKWRALRCVRGHATARRAPGALPTRAGLSGVLAWCLVVPLPLRGGHWPGACKSGTLAAECGSGAAPGP